MSEYRRVYADIHEDLENLAAYQNYFDPEELREGYYSEGMTPEEAVRMDLSYA
jgi:hypothetical protein